jgi:hypothetical protein
MKTAVRYSPVWLFMPIWALLAGVILWFSVGLAYENHLFAGNVIRQTAQVTRKFKMESHGKNGVHYTPCLIYVYDANGQQVTCQVKVLEDTWEHVIQGGVIPIKYLPETSSDNRIDLSGEDQIVFLKAAGGLTLGILIFAVGAFGFGYLIRQNKLRSQLIKEGIPCVGTVTSKELVRTGKGGIRSYLIFHFADQTGRRIDGKTWLMDQSKVSIWNRGSTIKVFYNRANSEQFTVDLKDRSTGL